MFPSTCVNYKISAELQHMDVTQSPSWPNPHGISLVHMFQSIQSEQERELISSALKSLSGLSHSFIT